MRLLISGYRDYYDSKNIKKHILNITKDEKDVVIIHGNCRGTDKTAGIIAKQLEYKQEIYNADWKKGIQAGPQRNLEMIVKGKPDQALIFMSKFSKGTKNMKYLLKQNKIKYTEINIGD